MSSLEPQHPFDVSQSSVSVVEARLMARRERVKAIAAAVREKGHQRVTSAGMIVTAFGAGVALEQVNRRHAWWLLSLLGAANTVARLANAAAALIKPTRAGAGP